MSVVPDQELFSQRSPRLVWIICHPWLPIADIGLTRYALRPAAGASIRGFLIIGLNSRQPYNDDLALFRQMLGRHITSSLASTLLFEVELRRYRRRVEQAATDRAALTKELLQRARETELVEKRFFRVAEQAAVGIFILNRDGSIIYVRVWFLTNDRAC